MIFSSILNLIKSGINSMVYPHAIVIDLVNTTLSLVQIIWELEGNSVNPNKGGI